MSDLCACAVTRESPAPHPDRIQLYSLLTPNNVKLSIGLEEAAWWPLPGGRATVR